MEPDIVARVVSLVSAIVALASLLIAVLSYRRGRPRVIIKDARVVTAMQNPAEDEPRGGNDTVLVQVLLVNRGQARVQLAAGGRSAAWPIMAEFQRSREPGRMSQSRADRANGQTLVSPLSNGLEHDQVDAFSGLSVSGQLPDDLLTRALQARLWRMRARITLSSGDVIFSHWFPTPHPWEGSIRRRQAELRKDAPTAMNDLAQALRESGLPQNMTMLRRLAKRAGLKAATVDDLLLGRGEPTWPVIAKIVDALDDAEHARSRLRMWKAKWVASLDAGKWADESAGESDPR